MGADEFTVTKVVPAGELVEARLVEMVFPGQTNHYGTLFGGQALALMDKAAFIVASRYSRCTVVTASSERCDFHVPVRQGQLIDLHARIVATGRTSMSVEVELCSEDLLTGARQLATRGRFLLVALDAQGKPTAVPPLPGASA
jgi:acyl-CoA hydrolase